MTHPLPDDGLRARLRTALNTASAHDSQHLEERVMAQWQQRHASAQAEFAAAGGAALRTPGMGRRALRLATGVVLVAALLVTASTWRSRDTSVEELMQLDVLSEMALGEM